MDFGFREAKLFPESREAEPLITCLPGSGIAQPLGRAVLPEQRFPGLQPKKVGKPYADHYDSSKHGRLGFLPRIEK